MLLPATVTALSGIFLSACGVRFLTALRAAVAATLLLLAVDRLDVCALDIEQHLVYGAG